jgi:hypothetical protein
MSTCMQSYICTEKSQALMSITYWSWLLLPLPKNFWLSSA